MTIESRNVATTWFDHYASRNMQGLGIPKTGTIESILYAVRTAGKERPRTIAQPQTTEKKEEAPAGTILHDGWQYINI